MSTVSYGNFTNKDLLDDITSFVTNHYTINKVKTNHLWVNELSDNILSKIDNVRTSNDILNTIQKTFPDSIVKSVPEVDEIYYAVSPKDASGSDRALVDCHFDAPFYWVPKNRQNSIETDDELLSKEWEKKQKEVIEKSKEVYRWAIENGIAKEQARVVLPEGNTISRLYMNGTLRSWIHYLTLRSENGTQKEHCLIAKECAIIISEIFPLQSL